MPRDDVERRPCSTVASTRVAGLSAPLGVPGRALSQRHCHTSTDLTPSVVKTPALRHRTVAEAQTPPDGNFSPLSGRYFW